VDAGGAERVGLGPDICAVPDAVGDVCALFQVRKGLILILKTSTR
jgi:hypothetical protein